MALELVTIVFAVTFRIWLHGLSERRHEQQQVKTFLVGLSTSIKILLAGRARRGVR